MIALQITWPDAKGFTDNIPAAWFQRDGQIQSVDHDVIDPKQRRILCRCDVFTKARIVTLNYETHRNFNAGKVSTGILRLTFENETRDAVATVEWKERGQTAFKPYEALTEIIGDQKRTDPRSKSGLPTLTADAVEKAIVECDQRGPAAFLKHYGFKRAKSYLLIHNGKQYDSKAIVAVAYNSRRMVWH